MTNIIIANLYSAVALHKILNNNEGCNSISKR